MPEKLMGLRVLLVEDSPVVAIATEGMLGDLGCVTVGPAGNMATALELAEKCEFDAAIIDINIRGTKTFSLLKILDRRQIPYLISSGYADWTMPDELTDRPRLPKPFGAELLRQKLTDLDVIQPLPPGGASVPLP